MEVRKFTIASASFERSPGQDGDVFAGNVIDQRHGGPITIGYGRYGPEQSINELLAVDDVMIVLEGQLNVSSADRSMTAGPGKMVYMPKGEKVTIRSHAQGAVTAYVTYPHWQQASLRRTDNASEADDCFRDRSHLSHEAGVGAKLPISAAG